jgi:hypothetical protein
MKEMVSFEMVFLSKLLNIQSNNKLDCMGRSLVLVRPLPETNIHTYVYAVFSLLVAFLIYVGHRKMDRQKNRQTDKWTERQMDTQADGQADK